MIKAVIFDFDGVIADSLSSMCDVANSLSGKYKYSMIDSTNIDRIRNMSPIQIMRELRVSRLKLPFIVRRLNRGVRERIDTIEIFPGMKEMIEDLSERYILGIITSNERENVEHILKKNGMIGLFSFIEGRSSLFGKHRTLRRMMRKRKLRPGEVIYIGDEVRDILSSRRAGVKVISVTWGYNFEGVLLEHKPDYLARSVEEIPRFISGTITA